MTGQGSYFKGWVDTQPNVGNITGPARVKQLYVGQVLDIDYKKEPGKIRVKILQSSKQQKDEEIKTQAYPANLNSVKYPLPGELVVMFEGLRHLTNKSLFTTAYYYTSVINSNSSITFNSDPYMGSSVPDKQATDVYTQLYDHKFESKIENLDSFVISETNVTKIKEREPLQPEEGDTLLQGRFGSSIRLGGTNLNTKDEWSVQGGIAGNPIAILSTNRSVGLEAKLESVNKEDSSIYVCSSQTIPVEIATSAQLKTHKYKYSFTK